MKKILVHTLVIIAFFIIYILQANFFNWFNIYGVKPNLFVVLVIFIGLFMGKIEAAVYGTLIGLLYVLLIGKNTSANAVILGLLGYAVGTYRNSFSKENRLNIMIIIASGTIIYEISIYILKIIFSGVSIQILEFLKILSIEILFNTILTIILYPIVLALGEKTDKVIHAKKAMRYY
ncbi:MAG: rod shape-determining protein MreD [Lachnospiraceae bacterium]|nr:rod shape-determining protein MreD [Lachnospiraceae bacterium]